MSEFFAEATVRLEPDLTGFITQLRAQLKTAIERVETGPRPPRVRVAPALTKNFIGDLRGQVNTAITQAQKGIRPIQVRAELSDLSSAQIARQLGRKTQTVRVAGAATQGSSIREAVRANEELVASQARVNTLVTQHGAALLGETEAQKTSNAERVRGARGRAQGAATKTKESVATRALAQAEIELVAAQRPELSVTAKLSQLRQAQSRFARVAAVAERELAAATTLSASASAAAAGQAASNRLVEIGRQIDRLTDARDRERAAITASNRALRASQAEMTRAARSQEQLRRGATATGLSFLGIRGATLAASASFLAGAAAFTILAKALQSATDFATNLNVFRATASATTTELERVREAARALGADITLPGVSSADAAESMVELAKAGLSVQDSIDGARGVLQLATAAAIENAQAVEITANALNAFQLQGRDATRVADTFANAANAAQGSIVDIGIAFQQAAAAGRQVGLSFEDTSLFLTVLARNGLRGSDAGTSLRTALIRLIRPTEAAKERLKELGVEVRDAQGNLRPDIFIQLAAATRDLGPAARDAVIAMVGGQDAFRAISILGRQSIKDFIALRQELRQQGTAAELAAARTQGLRGSTEALANTLQVAGVRAGRGLTPAIQGLVEGITSAAIAMSESENVARTFAQSLDFLETVGAALGDVLRILPPVLLELSPAFSSITHAIGIPTILAAIAVFKLYPAVFGRATASVTALAAAQTRLALTFRLLRDPGVTGRMAFLASAFGGAATAAALLGAGLFFLATRESAAEKATKRLDEAATSLTSSLAAARDAQSRASDARLSVNAARLAELEAQRAAGAGRSALQNSRAARGSFERRKLEFQLAVELDNVRIAQRRYNDILRESLELQDEARQAAQNAIGVNDALAQALEGVVQAQIKRVAGGQDFDTVAPAEQRRAIEGVTDAFRDQAQAARLENNAQSRNLARRLELLALVSDSLGDINKIPTAIDIVVDAGSAQSALQSLQKEFGITARQISDEFFSTLTSGTASEQVIAAITDLAKRLGVEIVPGARDSGRQIGRGLGDGVVAGIEDKGPDITAAIARIVARAQASLSGLERQALTLDIQGAGPAQVLANLRAQEVEARKILAAQEKRLAEGERAESSVRKAQENLARIINEIRSVETQMAADAKQAAADVKSKRDERDQALLELLGVRRERPEERISAADATPGLRDDIALRRRMRQLIVTQIKTIREQVQNAKLRSSAIRELRAANRELGREIRDLQRQRRQDLRDRVAESNQLDIELAQTNENRRAEIRARQREIARLKRLQDLTRQGSVEYKRYRNAIAEQQAAIKDLREQTKERNDEFRRLAFETLQRQQGFAANLLGNLIPLGATGGLVGNTGGTPLLGRPTGGVGAAAGAGIGGAIAQESALRDAQGAGPTRGQATVEIDLLREILSTLREIRGGKAHPEARQARATGSAVMDVM